MSLVGKTIADFSNTAFHNYDFVDINQDTLKGQWSVLCFYPADFTFVCPTELEDLQHQYAALKELNTEVYSVSTDTHFTHMAWHTSSPAIGSIEYFMIGDPNHHLTQAFDVLDEESGLAQRGTFIIDPDGVVQSIEINADGMGRNASILVDKIKAAQYLRAHPGEACPAKWQEGAKTLTPGIDLVGKI
jgi:peroxiredoxin (alkyl hydroperoxide reductase subunit C)